MNLKDIDQRKFIYGLLILVIILFIQIQINSNNKRYHLVIQQPSNGASRYTDPTNYLYDSKTGDVYSVRYEGDVLLQFKWKPKKKVVEVDSVSFIYSSRMEEYYEKN